MKNELVKETKKICSDVYETLKAKHAELKAEGASVRILNEIVSDMKKAIAIYKDVNEENVSTLNVEAINLQNIVEYKYAMEEEAVPEISEEEPTRETTEDAPVEETDVEENKKGVGAGAVALGLVGTTLLAGIAIHTGLEAKKVRNNNETTIEVVEETEAPVRVITTEAPTEEETKVEETKEEETTQEETQVEETEETQVEETTQEETEERQLVLGEYGTFFDINNPEQVHARAQYIFDNYYADNANLTAQQKQLITVENLENTIRIMNGTLPVNEEGYEFFDGMTLNEYTNVLVEVVVNSGSNVNDHYEYFPAYLLMIDGSEESEFVRSYSVIYDKLVYALNEHDDEQVQDAIACLGYKFLNEWYLQGMYGDTNPHLFGTDLKYLTFISTIEPYNTTAREWHLSEQTPVCITGCLNYETGEKELISVNDLVVALETGAWNNIGAKLGNMDVEPNPWLAEYYEALNDSLSWKYDHREALKLNK